MALVFIAVMVSILALDQWTKSWVVRRFLLDQSVPVLKGWLNFVHVRNTGVAFGLFNGPDNLPKTLFFTGVTLVAVGVVLYFLWQAVRRGDRFQALLLGMICGGAIGNLIDRFRYGAVIDFIDVYFKRYHWPAFNVGDAAISIGVILLMIRLAWRDIRGQREVTQNASGSISDR